MMTSYLSSINDPNSIVTAIDNAARFPEILTSLRTKYSDDIALFRQLISTSQSSAALLSRIRNKEFSGDQRMSLLKMFRRCVSPVLDTEMAKKINKISTESLVTNYGHTFKDIATLKSQFSNLSVDQTAALAALIGEYDTRGQLGYILTDRFFDWFESTFSGTFTINGPRGAGRDIELSTIFADFVGDYPCDFIIRDNVNGAVVAIGFARYDSTRGGAQSDDRTGGNSDKVSKARDYLALSREVGTSFRILFLSDGPGLAHNDTWKEACALDDAWNGNVRVATLKLAATRVTADWLRGIR
jgi:hypothetical protein